MVYTGGELDEKTGIPGGVLLCLASVSSSGRSRIDSRSATLSGVEIHFSLCSWQDTAVRDNDTNWIMGLGLGRTMAALNLQLYDSMVT